jgi:acetyl-CoA carboxylase biotin carboxyl carrier protein
LIKVKSPADLSQSDVERVLEIVDRLHDIEVHLEVDGMKLHVRKFSDASLKPAEAPLQAMSSSRSNLVESRAPAVTSPAAASGAHASVGDASVTSDPGLLEIRAPMLGRFFRASSPSEPAYVEVGSKIRPEDTVCMIEVMKLFNTVPAGVTGTIAEILVENGAMVEHDAVLFRVRPE